MQGYTHRTVSHSLGRRLGLGLAGLLVAALAGCGGGSTACHECVIVPLGNTTIDPVDVTPPPPGTVKVLGVTGGLGFVIQTSASNPMPVAGATVSFWGGGTFGETYVFTDNAGTNPSTPVEFLELKTDDHGMVRIFPAALVYDCTVLNATGDTGGSWSVKTATSNDEVTTSQELTLKCP